MEFDFNTAICDLLQIEVGRLENVISGIVRICMEEGEDLADIDQCITGVIVCRIHVSNACRSEFLEQFLFLKHSSCVADSGRIVHAENVFVYGTGFVCSKSQRYIFGCGEMGIASRNDFTFFCIFFANQLRGVVNDFVVIHAVRNVTGNFPAEDIADVTEFAELDIERRQCLNVFCQMFPGINNGDIAFMNGFIFLITGNGFDF